MNISEFNLFDYRKPDWPIDDTFIQRWSPRAFDNTGLSRAELMTILEAARWAPSASNAQNWMFFYAIKDDPNFELFLSFLYPLNQVWCKNAGALIVAAYTETGPDGKRYSVPQVNLGLAIENLLLEATKQGIVSHPMSGFDNEVASQSLKLPANMKPAVMIAVGHPGDLSMLDAFNQKREIPSTRKPLSEITHAGPLP